MLVNQILVPGVPPPQAPWTYHEAGSNLCKCVISGGSATVGTRANNEFMSFITLFQNLKFDQQKFYEK